MNAFLAGILFGVLLAGSVAVIIATRRPRPRRELPLWTEEHYQAPPVTTRIVNRHRSFEL